MTDLDKSGLGFQRVRTYLGPSLGWTDELVQPSTKIITGGSYTVVPGDSLLLVDFAGNVTISLPDVTKWIQQTANQPATGFERTITIKDFGGNAGNFNIGVTPFGTQKIDKTLTSYTIAVNGGVLCLAPLIDMSGWVVQTTKDPTGGNAPADAEYVVKSASSGLSQERVLTDSPTVTWDWGTPGQVMATVISGPFLPLSGGTITGDLAISKSTPALILQKPSAGPSAALTGQVSTNKRWQVILGDSAAESGGDAGSNFSILRYHDDGTFIDTPIGINRQTGAVALRNTNLLDAPTATTPSAGDSSTRIATTAFITSFGREKVTANRNYFIAVGGSDSNTGLVGFPWLTLQHAWDVISALDVNGFTITVSIGDNVGGYTGAVTIDKWWVGGGTVIFQGNAGTPSNVLQKVTGNNAWSINQAGPGILRLKDFKIQTLTSGDHIFIKAPVTLEYGNMDFGAAAAGGCHFRAFHPGFKINAISNYTISGGAAAHWLAYYGVIEQGALPFTVTVTGTPAFSVSFVYLDNNAKVNFVGTFSGAATGVRFTQLLLTEIQTSGGGPNFFPGNAAGSTAPSSVYA